MCPKIDIRQSEERVTYFFDGRGVIIIDQGRIDVLRGLATPYRPLARCVDAELRELKRNSGRTVEGGYHLLVQWRLIFGTSTCRALTVFVRLHDAAQVVVLLLDLNCSIS